MSEVIRRVRGGRGGGVGKRGGKRGTGDLAPRCLPWLWRHLAAALLLHEGSRRCSKKNPSSLPSAPDVAQHGHAARAPSYELTSQNRLSQPAQFSPSPYQCSSIFLTVELLFPPNCALRLLGALLACATFAWPRFVAWSMESSMLRRVF